MKVCWFSGGGSSFAAAYLERKSLDKIIYIDINDQHEDTMRFLHDCEDRLEREIEILKSPLASVENVCRTMKAINFPPIGAVCTRVLKRQPRQMWEAKHQGEKLTYIWGFDSTEKKRIARIRETMPQYNHVFPLAKNIMTKEDVHGFMKRLNLKRPEMYERGYSNNNCIGCVKGGMGYWNKIRVDFPEVFAARAKMERDLGHTCINGIYLDELEPHRGRIENEIMDDCGILCEIAFREG